MDILDTILRIILSALEFISRPRNWIITTISLPTLVFIICKWRKSHKTKKYVLITLLICFFPWIDLLIENLIFMYLMRPREIPEKVTLIEASEEKPFYLYQDKKACYNKCILNHLTEPQICGPVHIITRRQKSISYIFIGTGSSVVQCQKVRTEDGIEGWM